MNKKVVVLAFLLLGILGLHCSKSGAQLRFRQTKDMVVAGGARFEVLSPTLVRMEYSQDGHFINQRSVVVVRRKWPFVKITAGESNGWLTVSTGKITLKYLLGSGKFTRHNLDVVWTYGNQERKWSPGDSDTMNLGGIVHSLDEISGKHLPGFTEGLLSRSGYYVLNDSRSPLWNMKTKWIEPRPAKSSQDWYFFAYGKDYRHGLYECSELCGKIPMMPRYALGTWMTDLNYECLSSSPFVTQYFSYTSRNLKDEIERFRGEGLPLDVLVLDFGWHKYGWQGGYDWSPIFSNPVRFLKWAHEYGLHVSVNDHPGNPNSKSVLSNKDSRAMEVRKLLGLPMPPKPSLLIKFNKNWKFRLDPHDQGLQDDWYSTSFNDDDWQVLQAGESWQDQGHPHVHGFAWYRKWVKLPSKLPNKVYAIFGGVDDEYDLFINGEKVAHHGGHGQSVYDIMTITDVKNHVKPSKANLVAIRVKDWGGYGGLTELPVEFSNVLPPGGIKFNLANKYQARVFMKVLHAPVMRDGVDFWWIDGSGACKMKGLNNQLWTNRVYYDYTRHFTHERGLIFSRYGGWGNERYPAFFTGDTHSEWAVLKYEVPFTARAGNVLMPYVTHDIGGFLGDSIGVNMYSRWLQFGALSPIMRLHCGTENPLDGNMRMPWVYGRTAVRVARIFLNLRERLIPYIYTYTRVAYDSALPVVRPLYLKYPDLPEAYHHPNEYLFGNEFLVAPITDSTGVAPVYFPPGEWVNYFTGEKYSGGQSISDTCSITTMPLYVKEGSIVPMQPSMAYSDQRRIDTLTLDVFGPRSGSFDLYQDDGTSLAYQHGAYSWTMFHFTRGAEGGYHLVVEPTKGRFRGQLSRRAYAITVHGIHLPTTVALNGRLLSTERSSRGSWEWDNNTSSLRIYVPFENIRKRLDISIR